MARIIYRSGINYDEPSPQWREEGRLLPCVTTGKVGKFTCECGQHHVHAEMSADPLDQQERIARTVTLIKTGEPEIGDYTLTTWSYYTHSGEPVRTEWPITVSNDEAALMVAQEVLRVETEETNDIVGVLTAPDGQAVARLYIIRRKEHVGEGMCMHSGSWRFFAADDEAARKILEGLRKGDSVWSLTLFGPDQINHPLARK